MAQKKDEDSIYLFSRNGKHLSNMALTELLRRMEKDFTVHGFRSTFRDWVAEETQHSPEVAEKALAHSIQNKVESAYRRGDLMEPRKRLMGDWESYCQTGSWGNVITLSEQKAA
jgi:integrase